MKELPDPNPKDKAESSDQTPKSNRKRISAPKPKPFHMGELFQERGLWSFWLTAPREVLQYVEQLPPILNGAGSSFRRTSNGRRCFSISPRYNHEETWEWIHQTLEVEALSVELNEGWESAIEEAQRKPRNKDKES